MPIADSLHVLHGNVQSIPSIFFLHTFILSNQVYINMIEIKTKEYRIPMPEFIKTFGIKEKISSVSYYGSSCKTGEEKEDYVTIETEAGV